MRRAIEQARAERGVAHVALSGGGTPERTYRLLGEDPEALRATELWFADERCVGARRSREQLPAGQRDAAGTGRDPGPRWCTACRASSVRPRGREQLRERAAPSAWAADPDEPVTLDLVVLGIGPDGHVASLFPGSATLAEERALCLGVEDSPKPPPERITLSLPVLRAARGCLLVALGASKADALAAMLGEPTAGVPASLLRRERLTVITDDAAAPPAPNRR